MDYETWQLKRKQLMEEVKRDRQTNWQAGHPNVGIAVIEMALRDLYDKVEALEAKKGK